MAVITPSPSYTQNFQNDAFFAIRMQKIVDKVIKYQDRGNSDKLLDTMIDLKQEVESYTGVSINLDQQLNQVEKELKKKGVKISKKEMAGLRKIISQKEKQSNHKVFCMEMHLEDPTLQLSLEDEQMLYLTKYGNEKGAKDDTGELPLRVTIGVTVALCGLFLCFLPLPACKVWGGDLMKAGIALAVEGYVNRQEESKAEK